MSNLWNYREGTMSADSDVVGYDVEATDGTIGKIDASTNDTDHAHVVVDTGWWIFGKKRLIPAGVIAVIDHRDRKVAVEMTKRQIKNSPDFDETLPRSSSNRGVFDDYYGPFGR